MLDLLRVLTAPGCCRPWSFWEGAPKQQQQGWDGSGRGEGPCTDSSSMKNSCCALGGEAGAEGILYPAPEGGHSSWS